jgi:thiazole synthase
MKNDKIVIANKKFNSRLIVGTGKYKSMSECAKAIKAFWSRNCNLLLLEE